MFRELNDEEIKEITNNVLLNDIDIYSKFTLDNFKKIVLVIIEQLKEYEMQNYYMCLSPFKEEIDMEITDLVDKEDRSNQELQRLNKLISDMDGIRRAETIRKNKSEEFDRLINLKAQNIQLKKQIEELKKN
jgi:hypothetical protein